MKTFKVFRHSTIGFQAIKVGFSWPACFFTVIWAFVKKLWGYGFGILGISILADLALNEKAFFEMILFQLGVVIFVGFKGNEWRVNNLQKRGFELVDTLQAETPDAAIGTAAKTLGNK